jgi:hypothetical protein
MTTIVTASSGGRIASHQPKANKAVPKPASPLINPPASAPVASMMDAYKDIKTLLSFWPYPMAPLAWSKDMFILE